MNFQQKPKNTPAYEKAEDPLYVLDNSIPVDAEHYLHHALENPLLRIFEPVLGLSFHTPVEIKRPTYDLMSLSRC